VSTELVPFAYGDSAVRVVMVDGEPWFVLTDLCRVLGLTRSASAVAERLDDEVRQAYPITDSLGRTQQATIVSESGMYEVVIRSDKPEAVVFRRWITTEVLPAIRKTGGYSVDPLPAIPQTYADALRACADEYERAESEKKARIEAEHRAKELEAPASAWSHMAESSGDYAVNDAAKVLTRDPSITIGGGRLFSFMAAEGWIYRGRGTNRWKAYQTQVDCGRLVEKLGTPFLHEPTGEMRVPEPTIRITPKGLAELHKRLGGSSQLALMAEVS
jgi:anti-repressor protein